MIQRIETAFRSFRRWLSRSEWAVRILRLPREGEALSAKPGLIILQIDGLARKQFETAIDSGRLPFLKKLIDKEHYHTHSWYSGLPSSTPAVQGELFYGIRTAVPAFQFVDHQTNKFRVMLDQSDAAEVEKSLASQSEGLLKGGSSYSNIYQGGADESHFCVSSMGWSNFLRLNANPLRLALIALMNFPSLLRVLGLMVLETCIAVVDAFRGIIAHHDLFKEIKFIPIRVGVCIMLREFISISVRMDIARGLPVIHANLLGYDEQAHRRGPGSLFAHWTLQGIDRVISHIASEAKRSRFRHYDLWIYSDHGQETTTPLHPDIQQTVSRAFQKLGRETSLDSGSHHTTHGRGQLLFRQSERSPDLEPASSGEFIKVAAMGPVGHVYCRDILSDAEKSILALEVTRTGGVPMALFIDAHDQLIACSGDQFLPLAENREKFLGSAHPFLDEAVEDLCDLCEHPDAGQIVLSGYCGGKAPVSFPLENGAHAGVGPEETHGFALLPDDTTLPTREKDHIRPIDLRHTALHFLGREEIVEPFYIKSARAEKDKNTLRIMTYNVHQCRGMDGKCSPARIARVIAQYAPDIVALQELDVGRLRSDHEDQAQLIARHLQMEHHFHPAIHLEEERYGDAILTHYPMELVKAELLPSVKQAIEPRGALWVKVTVNGEPIHIINTHLGLSPEEKRVQVKALLGEQWLRHPECKGRVILCGDFNLLPSSRTFKELTKTLTDTQSKNPRPTFTSRLPIGRIDHILLDREAQLLSTSVPSTGLTCVASDHLPLIVNILCIPQHPRTTNPQSHVLAQSYQ
jgi:endonuclease/exonuclease/phosphatase family metal-dependent hydrolase